MKNLHNPEELWEAVAEVPRLVVHFGASWNKAYDSEMQRRLEPIMPRYNDRIEFATADGDAESLWPLMREWRALGLPALVLFAFGLQIGTHIGRRSDQQLIKLFDELASIQK